MSKPPLDEQSMLDFNSRYQAWRSSHCASLEIYGAHSKALSLRISRLLNVTAIWGFFIIQLQSTTTTTRRIDLSDPDFNKALNN